MRAIKRAMKSASRFKFQVTRVPRPSWALHFSPSLWHARYLSLLPDEFSYVYTSPDWISVTCNQDSCLINIPLCSFVNYLFTLFAHFSTGCFLFLIYFYERIIYIEAIFSACHWLLSFVMIFFWEPYFALSNTSIFFLITAPQTIRNSHLCFLLDSI